MAAIPVAFILTIIGIFFLLIDYLPLLGWIFILIAMANGLIVMTLKYSDNATKYSRIAILGILLFLIVFLLIYSAPRIIFSAKQTWINFANLIY
jgi:hypothetical protein